MKKENLKIKKILMILLVLIIISSSSLGCYVSTQHGGFECNNEDELKATMEEKVKYDKEKTYYLFDLSFCTDLEYGVGITQHVGLPETVNSFASLYVSGQIVKEKYYFYCSVNAGMNFTKNPKYNEIEGEIKDIEIDGMKGESCKRGSVDRKEEGDFVDLIYRLYVVDGEVNYTFTYREYFKLSNEDYESTGEYEHESIEPIKYDEFIELATRVIQSKYVIEI